MDAIDENMAADATGKRKEDLFATPPRATRARVAAIEGDDLVEEIDEEEEKKAKSHELERLMEFDVYEPVGDEEARHCKKLSTK